MKKIKFKVRLKKRTYYWIVLFIILEIGYFEGLYIGRSSNIVLTTIIAIIGGVLTSIAADTIEKFK